MTLFLLAAAAGVLAFLGFVGFGYWPLALACLVPLWLALEQSRNELLWKPALIGFVFGFVAYAGGFHWMWRIVDVFLAGNLLLGALLWVGDASWFALRFAIYGTLYVIVRRRGRSVAVAAVPTLLVIEWLYPMLFPVYLGHALAALTLHIQIADLGGPLLLTALLASINVAFLETARWFTGERSRPDRVWVCALIVLSLSGLYGVRRVSQVETAIAAAPELRIGIVQGNLGVAEKGHDATLDHRRYLEQTRELLTREVPDLIVWPETVYSRGLLRPLPLSGRLIRADVDVPLLFGAATVRGDSGRRLKYNSALLIGADGVIRDVYDKNLLIPFTEYVPFADLLRPFVPSLADTSEFSASHDTPALSFGAWRIATPICYEAVRPAFVRRMVREAEPDLIVTLANDSWFGDSQEPWLHLVMAKMRAVEHHRYLVRATNSGISAVVDPLGNVVARTGLLTRENLLATVHPLSGRTLYARWGDWAGWVSLALLSLAMYRSS
jgi:apolipoprotein N-acyltransferase